MGTSIKKTALVAALTATLPTIASPQGGAGASGGVQVDLGISSSLTVDDNFQLKPVSPGTSTTWDNRLTFGITSSNQTQRLSLTGSTVLRFADIPGRTVSGFEDPNLRFSYALDGSNSRLAFDARYRDVDREFLNPFQVEQEEQQFGSLVGDGGSQVTQNYRLTFDTGLNDPFGLSFNLGRDVKDYSNTVNPTLFDAETDTAAVTARFTVSPVTQLSLTASEKWYEADDAVQTDRETLDVSVGLQQDITQTLLMNASLGYSDIETTTTGGTTTRSGATGSLGLTQAFNNGSASVNLSQTQNQNGARTSLDFGRQLQLPNGSIGGTLGLSEGPSGDVDWTARLAYATQLKSSNFNASLQRGVTTNNQNAEVVDTRLTVGYGLEIDNSSRFDVTFNYGRTESGGIGLTPTVDRTNLRAAYTRSLTADWNLQGGVQLRRIDDDSAVGPADSNSLFLTLDRTFSFRP